MIVSSSSNYEGLCASGEGMLCKSDMSFWMDLPERTAPGGVVFEISEGVTAVEEGFFELLPTVYRLNIPKSLKALTLTEAELDIFRKNGIIISGVFDSFAESFARENGFSFMHTDIDLAHAGDYFEGGSYHAMLHFYSDGRAVVRQESFSQGSSAGSSLGTDDDVALKMDFYENNTPKDIADMCWGCFYQKIQSNKELQAFLKKAKQKGGYYLSFRK